MVENRMSDTKKRILQEARDFVYRELKDDSSGHDWWHIVRVANNAVAIAEKEGAACLMEREEKAAASPPQAAMESLFTSSLSAAILSLDVMTMTPLEAMNALYKLQNQAREEAGKT